MCVTFTLTLHYLELLPTKKNEWSVWWEASFQTVIPYMEYWMSYNLGEIGTLTLPLYFNNVFSSCIQEREILYPIFLAFLEFVVGSEVHKLQFGVWLLWQAHDKDIGSLATIVRLNTINYTIIGLVILDRSPNMFL